MFNKILGTFFSKGFVAFISFGTLLLTTHNLGAQGRGDISIITTVVGLMGLVNGFMGGGTLVYLMPRHKNRRFFTQAIIFSLLWAILVCLFGTVLYRYGYQIQSDYWEYVLCLGLLTCVYSFLLLMILSNEYINTYNIIGVLQPSLNFIFFAGAILYGYVEVTTFIYCLSISYICALIIEIVIIKKIGARLEKTADKVRPVQTIKKIMSLGSMAQLGNVIQYLNYRFSYFIINTYIGAAGVGIYSVGVSISESVWILAQSISLVQYSTIANSEDEEYASALTVKLAKLSFIVTLVIISGIVLLPGAIFSFIFGKEFAEVRTVLLFLSPSIVIFGFGLILSHYFAGKGQYHINTIASLLGLIVSIPGCFIMIPKFGYIGAALTANLSNLIVTIFLLVFFKRESGIDLIKFKINKADFEILYRLFAR
jgi:O-antigen/teichoic acid export membrane protein